MSQMHNPPHPGAVLADTVLRADGGMTVTELADRLGVSRVALSRVVNGRAAVSAELAIRLGQALGTSAEVWMGMQMARDLWQASKKRRPKIKRIEQPPARPVVLEDAVQRAAARKGMDMSAYVLSRVLTAPSQRFQDCVAGCAREASSRFALAELNSLLTELTPSEMRDAVAAAPSVALPPFLANYVAALVEYGCARCSVAAPAWTRSIAPLESPVFGSSLQSLRLHLLTHSPPPFRRRNIFIDSSLGQRV